MSISKPTISIPLASVTQRLLAVLVDILVILGFSLVVYLIPIILQGINAGVDSHSFQIAINVFWIIFSVVEAAGLVYYLFIWPVRNGGQSIGKKFQKIKIMVAEDIEKGKIRLMKKDDYSVNFNRVIGYIVDGVFFGLIGIYLINENPNNQRFGDKIANTVVIISEHN